MEGSFSGWHSSLNKCGTLPHQLQLPCHWVVLGDQRFYCAWGGDYDQFMLSESIILKASVHSSHSLPKRRRCWLPRMGSSIVLNTFSLTASSFSSCPSEFFLLPFETVMTPSLVFRSRVSTSDVVVWGSPIFGSWWEGAVQVLFYQMFCTIYNFSPGDCWHCRRPQGMRFCRSRARGFLGDLLLAGLALHQAGAQRYTATGFQGTSYRDAIFQNSLFHQGLLWGWASACVCLSGKDLWAQADDWVQWHQQDILLCQVLTRRTAVFFGWFLIKEVLSIGSLHSLVVPYRSLSIIGY